MVHLYHGNGKGKTTAAMGLALRMLGEGKTVFIVQFLKGQPSAEVMALLKIPGTTILRGKPGCKFIHQMTAEEKEETASLHSRQLCLAVSAAQEGKADLLVLDEALDAVGTGTLGEETLLDAIQTLRIYSEIVLTGRNPSDAIISCADYITYMKKEKHPFDAGTLPRICIEY